MAAALRATVRGGGGVAGREGAGTGPYPPRSRPGRQLPSRYASRSRSHTSLIVG
ncbi:predicted protein [Streptomyces sp. SPB78]|nr:predicted protein [Streptomyces sp. SPB78]